MLNIKEIIINTTTREELIDITGRVITAIDSMQLTNGLVQVYIPHTTAGVLINENADPSVLEDILAYFRARVPRDDGYQHGEGNSDAHIKAILVGNSQQLLVQDGRLVLGTWQGIFFAEFDGPRHRKVLVGSTAL